MLGYAYAAPKMKIKPYDPVCIPSSEKPLAGFVPLLVTKVKGDALVLVGSRDGKFRLIKAVDEHICILIDGIETQPFSNILGERID